MYLPSKLVKMYGEHQIQNVAGTLPEMFKILFQNHAFFGSAEQTYVYTFLQKFSRPH